MGEPLKVMQADSFVARSQIRAVVRAEIQKFCDNVLAEAIGMAIAEAKREMVSAFEDFTTQLTYRGNWSAGVTYQVGNFVSHGGIWHCNHSCRDVKPGADVINWSLAVPRGKDGRDGRDFRGVVSPESDGSPAPPAPPADEESRLPRTVHSARTMPPLSQSRRINNR